MKLLYLVLIIFCFKAIADNRTECNPHCEVIVISDLNQSYGSTSYSSHVHAAIESIIDLKPDLVITTGDHVAGQQSGLNYQKMWNAFHKAVTLPLLENSIPLAPAAGNHDASAYPAFAEERAIYKQQWIKDYKPAVKYLDQDGFPFRYSYALGPALFIVIDSTTTQFPMADQKWVEYNLKKYSSLYPIKIIYGHVPLYPFAKKRETEYMHAPNFEKLLNEYDVDLFISGHHHAYYPGRRGNLALVGTACLGGGARVLIGDTTEIKSKKSLIRFTFDNNRIISLNAYTGKQFQQLIPRSSLPDQVGSDQMIIVRDQQFL